MEQCTCRTDGWSGRRLIVCFAEILCHFLLLFLPLSSKRVVFVNSFVAAESPSLLLSTRRLLPIIIFLTSQMEAEERKVDGIEVKSHLLPSDTAASPAEVSRWWLAAAFAATVATAVLVLLLPRHRH